LRVKPNSSVLSGATIVYDPGHGGCQWRPGREIDRGPYRRSWYDPEAQKNDQPSLQRGVTALARIEADPVGQRDQLRGGAARLVALADFGHAVLPHGRSPSGGRLDARKYAISIPSGRDLDR
jgi:hypothetical protein